MRLNVLALVTLLTVSLGCSKPSQSAHEHAAEEKKGEEQHHEESLTLTAEQQRQAGIQIDSPKPNDNLNGLVVNGVLSVPINATLVITPPVGGILERWTVKLGDRVSTGQTLGVLRSSELVDRWRSISEAKQALLAAQAKVMDEAGMVKLCEQRLAAVRETLDRQRKFASAGTFSNPSLSAARTELNEAESELKSVTHEAEHHQDVFARLKKLHQDGIVSTLDFKAAEHEVEQDEIKIEKAATRVKLAKAALSREERVYKEGLANSREVESTRAEVDRAVLELTKAKQSLESANRVVKVQSESVRTLEAAYRSSGSSGGPGNNVGVVPIKSPGAGTVVHVDVSVGRAVDRTQTLAEIAQLETLWATAQVPETQLESIQVGMPVTVLAGSVKVTGRVSVIESKVDAKTRTIPVQCTIDNPGGKLRSGQFVKISLSKSTEPSGWTVPESAVFEEDGNQFVFIESGGKFLRKPVKGITPSSRGTVCLEGITGSDRVVTQGVFALKSELKKGEIAGHEH